MHVKTKSAWATNSAMGRGAVRSWRFWQRFVPNSRRFRDRTGQGAVFGPVASRAVVAVVLGRRLMTLTAGVAARRVETLIASFHRILLFGATRDAARY